MSPYDIFFTHWGGLSGLQKVISRGNLFTCTGDNEIHVRGFFKDLSALAVAFGDARWWLIDLDGDEHQVEFESVDTEENYFRKLQNAPEWAPGRPFPYAVRYQAFIGSNWILISDRDDEQMHLVIRDNISPAQLVTANALVKN